MPSHQHSRHHGHRRSGTAQPPTPAEHDTPFAFDAWMWRYLQTESPHHRRPASGRTFDNDAVEDAVELAWKFLQDRKYHQAQQQCQHALTVIERHLAQDFAHNSTALTLFDDDDDRRRDAYLETLDVYQHVLVSQVVAILLKTDDLQDIDPHYAHYQQVRQQIQREISKAAYLLGDAYDPALFLTRADLSEFDDLVRQHCQYVLKAAFFTAFKHVIQALGPLNRQDFHRVTEPYKTLRDQCAQCLTITARMRNERFFGPHDVFIDYYERDVKLYLQILWYLGLKSDLNKIDKLLHPNTYAGGLDAQAQVFDTIGLLRDIRPHLQEARAVGLSDRATAAILEIYAEHWNVVLRHEAAHISRDSEHAAANAARLERINALQAILEQYTIPQTKTRVRVDFAYKFLKKTPLAFRLQEHKMVEVSNPDGRALKDANLAVTFLEALNAPLFEECLQDLRLQYRSRGGVKLQKLRWAWFAERALPPGFFEQPRYNYLAYINDRWHDKIERHHRLLQNLSQRDDA